MATSQMVRPEEKTGTWSSMFPVEQVTEQQSALFTKKLLAVAISNITYLRAIFPEQAYGDRFLGDMNLKILRDDSSCPGASQVIKWVKGVFDALDKKYLRLLLIGIYLDPDNPQTVIESYTFKFFYSNACGVDIFRNGKKIASAEGTEKTKKETIQLLRTIIVLTQTLQPLPENVMLTMKILYYDEVTPADYEPPGFKTSDIDALQFDEEPVNIKLGDVSTAFHAMKVRIKTDKRQFNFHNDGTEDASAGQPISNSGLDRDQEGDSQVVTAPPQEEASVVPQSDGDVTNNVTTAIPEKADVPCTSPAKPEGTEELAASKAPKVDDFVVRCPCGCNEDDGLMVVCDVCNFWQHAICFNILDEEHAPEEHNCDVCAKEDNTRKPTDPYLKDLHAYAVQATCLWRRTLVACTEFQRLLPHQLANRLGVESSVAQGLLKRLEKEGFLSTPAKSRRLGKVVNKDKVEKTGIPTYLKKPQKQPENKDAVPEQVEKMDTSEKTLEPKPKDNATISRKDATATQQDVNTKISQMTDKAASISIQSHQLRSASAKRKPGMALLKGSRDSANSDTAAAAVAKDSNHTDSEKRRGHKRAFSRVDQSGFDLCDSQETRDTRSSRRKKCSDVRKSIRV